MKKIILASGSPRRKELLKQIGIEFEVMVSAADENSNETDPEKLVEILSSLKCSSCADRINNTKESAGLSDEGCIVIGADTIVVNNKTVLGKPSSNADAFSMLKSLSGKTHTVYTGVTIMDSKTKKTVSFAEGTQVTMNEISDEEINDYIASKEPMDKAGSYGIQGLGAKFIKGINGDFYNVVGLPVARVYAELKHFI